MRAYPVGPAPDTKSMLRKLLAPLSLTLCINRKSAIMEFASKDIKADITDIEGKISEILVLKDRTEDQIQSVGQLCAFGLNEIFHYIDSVTGLRGWALDDLYVQDSTESAKKITLSGISHWLNGGANCERFQADIAKTTNPILYSFKFYKKSSNSPQVLYVGKTNSGWVVNA